MKYSGGVIANLSPAMQDVLASSAAYQRAVAPAAAEALRDGALSPSVDTEIREQAADILDNFAQGNLTQEGYEHVPLSSGFGEDVLPGTVQAITSYRVPVLGARNHFDLRPVQPLNRPNYIAFLAINGLGADRMVSFNTGSNGNHVAVVSNGTDRAGGLIEYMGRILPVDGEGDTRTADAILMTDPDINKGIVGANADNPIIVGTAGRALVAVNGGWNNLGAGIDLRLRGKMHELGLLRDPVYLAEGASARRGFEVRRSKLRLQSEARKGLGGDPDSYQEFIDREPHPDPEKTNLELGEWAKAAVGGLAVNGEIVDMDLCTIEGGRAGYLHSSRVHRLDATVPGQMAGGGRNMTAIVPRHIQQIF